jgi:hypothetical protein
MLLLHMSSLRGARVLCVVCRAPCSSLPVLFLKNKREHARQTKHNIYVCIRGATCVVAAKQHQFPPLHILTHDDGRIARNM